MSVEELIQAFEHSNKRANDIRGLANRFNISEREVIDTLNKFNIKTPKIIGRSDAIDIGDEEIKEIKTKIELELDDDIAPAVSIIRKFEDMGWTKKEGRERAVQLSYYIETKLGLDCFKIYVSMLEYIIKNRGVRKLEQDIDSIKNGNSFNIIEKPETRIMNTLLRATDNFLEGILEPEPEAKPIKEKPLLIKVYEAYNMLKNPEKYRFDQWHRKEAKKKEAFNKGLKIIRGVLDYE